MSPPYCTAFFSANHGILPSVCWQRLSPAAIHMSGAILSNQAVINLTPTFVSSNQTVRVQQLLLQWRRVASAIYYFVVHPLFFFCIYALFTGYPLRATNLFRRKISVGSGQQNSIANAAVGVCSIPLWF
jgi:hypothetical protein